MANFDYHLIEPVCCRKQQKKRVPCFWNREPLKILNGVKLILGLFNLHLFPFIF